MNIGVVQKTIQNDCCSWKEGQKGQWVAIIGLSTTLFRISMHFWITCHKTESLNKYSSKK